MKYTELVVNAYDCEAELNNKEFIENMLKEAVKKTGVTVVGESSHKYTPHGLSTILFLAESHIAIHTWPEFNFALVEINLANEKNPREVWANIKKKLSPKNEKITEINYNPNSSSN